MTTWYVMPGGEVNIVDLFCGCGGNMSGCHDAVKELRLTYTGLAINHWAIAVETMRANFPGVTTLDCKIEEAVPDKLVHGTVHLLWASPSCTHHSRAAGGRPRSDQLRSQPEYVTTWLRMCNVLTFIVENVPEFTEWGPLDPETGTPIKERKGETFRAWLKMIESLGYQVEWRILNCADYGDATTRRRFFLIGTKAGLPPPSFPEPTYGDHVPGLPQWRGAGECLDLADLGRSIFGRARPLKEKTLARLAAGARKYWGLDITTDMLVKACSPRVKGRSLKPFIVKLNRGATTEDVDAPLTTVLAGGNHRALVQARPFIAKMRHNATTAPLGDPLTTISAGGGHHALCSLVCDHQNHGKACTPDRPMKTVSTHDHFSLATLVLGQHGGAACRPADRPIPTACVRTCMRMFQPIVVDNANGWTIRGSGQPLNTITLKDQHMLALPVLEDGRRIDIYMRMLKPRELARAHSLPDDFVLCGNKTQQTKQVGNSVPAMTAKALCMSVLKELVA